MRTIWCLALVALPLSALQAHAATGTATVSRSGATCPAQHVGHSATGFVAGMAHARCTAAKNIARANLRGMVPAGCARYITSTRPCTPP